MKAARLFVVNVIIILLLIIAGFVGYYFYNQSQLYLKTDDATVAGQQIAIASPVAGKLTSWKGTLGTKFSTNDTVGQVQVMNGKTAETVNIQMPAGGTIVQNTAVQNSYVAPGMPLAYAYDMSQLYVTANIKETQIQDVKVGDTVDVYVDALPGTTVTGTIKQIGLATASMFSMIPSSNTNANFTKVQQVIPVTISLQGIPSGLAPGMNVSVRIHK